MKTWFNANFSPSLTRCGISEVWRNLNSVANRSNAQSSLKSFAQPWCVDINLSLLMTRTTCSVSQPTLDSVQRPTCVRVFCFCFVFVVWKPAHRSRTVARDVYIWIIGGLRGGQGSWGSHPVLYICQNVLPPSLCTIKFNLVFLISWSRLDDLHVYEVNVV